MSRGQSQIRGFTIVEVLVALSISGLLIVFVLMLARSQLTTYEMHGQVSTVQQNARAAFDLIESTVRGACGGIGRALITEYVTTAAGRTTGCLNIFDGVNPDSSAGKLAGTTGGSFTAATSSTDKQTYPDAIEVISYDGTIAGNITAGSGTTLTVGLVASGNGTGAGLKANDLILISNMDCALVFKVASDVASPYTSITLSRSLPSAPNTAFAFCPTPVAATSWTNPGLTMLKAKSVSLYVYLRPSPCDPNSAECRQLNLDPDGLAGSDHADAEPLIENVVDFQLALGVDSDSSGTLTDATSSTDEWLYNTSADDPSNNGTVNTLANVGKPATPAVWNNGTAQPQVRAVRMSLLVRTSNKYAGASAPNVTRLEDKTAAYTTDTSGPRYRTMQMVVMLRGLNLGE